jgi:hypothetical protein
VVAGFKGRRHGQSIMTAFLLVPVRIQVNGDNVPTIFNSVKILCAASKKQRSALFSC